MGDWTVRGELKPCEQCGRLKSEYVDIGTHGVYRCWWCKERVGGEGDVMTDGECRECGVALPGGGYLCDDCDELEIVESDCSAGWRAEARHQRASAGRDHE